MRRVEYEFMKNRSRLIRSRHYLRQAIVEQILHDVLDYPGSDGLRNKIAQYLPSKKVAGEEAEIQDLVDESLKELRKRYYNAGRFEINKLRQRLWRASNDLPHYHRWITFALYWLLRWLGKSTFKKIWVTGYTKEVLEATREGRLVIVPTHTDMFDPIISVYIFLQAGMRPPIYHAGENLKRFPQTWLIQACNALFIKRKQLNAEGIVFYAYTIMFLLYMGRNQTIYAEGTRSRDGHVAPLISKKRDVCGKEKMVKGMTRGYLGAILRANAVIEEDIKFTFVSIAAPIFADVYKDFQREQKTGQKHSFLAAVFRFFSSTFFYNRDELVHPDSGIYVHFTRPETLAKGIKAPNIKPYRLYFTRRIREILKENIYVLPENILAYALRYLEITDKNFNSHPPERRKELIRQVFLQILNYVKDNKIAAANVLEDQDKAWQIALKFYQYLGIISPDFTFKNSLILEYNSNRVQHHFKKFLPLKSQDKKTFPWLKKKGENIE